MKKIPLASFAVLMVAMGCSEQNPRTVTKFNQDAALSGKLPANPLSWRVITTAANRQDATISTLFGNEVAIQYTRANAQHDYPAGSVISLVTWRQQEDPRWFGANIPAAPKSVEFVTVKADTDRRVYLYQNYEGTPLQLTSNQQTATPNARATDLLAQRAAVMP